VKGERGKELETRIIAGAHENGRMEVDRLVALELWYDGIVQEHSVETLTKLIFCVLHDKKPEEVLSGVQGADPPEKKLLKFCSENGLNYQTDARTGNLIFTPQVSSNTGR
jgi:hypothetical protein